MSGKNLHPCPDPAGHPLVEMREVVFEYPDGTLALRGVDLTVGRGERVALLGPNGAGKSTLILHVNGVLLARSGEVCVCGTPVRQDTLREVRAKVGLVFQDPDDQLFMTTVYDDVAFGPLNMGLSHEEVDARVHRALHAVGMADLASKSGQHLSFGQKKRVALATVLSMDSELLVLDEPTSNLDPRGRRAMIELLSGMGRTSIVATHDMELAGSLCERAVVMDDGIVVADGPSAEVLGDRELLERHGLEASAGRGGGGRGAQGARDPHLAAGDDW